MNKERLVEIRIEGKTIGWYGIRFPKKAQEIINEAQLNKQEVKKNG